MVLTNLEAHASTSDEGPNNNHPRGSDSDDSHANLPSALENGFSTAFLERPMRRLPNAKQSRRPDAAEPQASPFRIMTYNILAQTLIRRDQFRESGRALKWSNRKHVLQRELLHYDCDIYCLQECGQDMYHDTLKQFFAERYSVEFHCAPRKKHGLLIAFSRKRFSLDHHEVIDYSMGNASNPRNIGLVTVLKERASGFKLTVATTHLYWHPDGSCERLRQATMLMTEVARIDSVHGSGHCLYAGDFNTNPTDPLYSALVRRPFHLNDPDRELLEHSAGHLPADNDDDTPLWQRNLKTLSEASPLTSLYGSHYKYINTDHIDKVTGEPICTNCAQEYRGCLDYLFVKSPTDSVQCTALLELPDLSVLSHGQPEEGKCCSDHFALSAELCIQET